MRFELYTSSLTPTLSSKYAQPMQSISGHSRAFTWACRVSLGIGGFLGKLVQNRWRLAQAPGSCLGCRGFARRDLVPDGSLLSPRRGCFRQLSNLSLCRGRWHPSLFLLRGQRAGSLSRYARSYSADPVFRLRAVRINRNGWLLPLQSHSAHGRRRAAHSTWVDGEPYSARRPVTRGNWSREIHTDSAPAE